VKQDPNRPVTWPLPEGNGKPPGTTHADGSVTDVGTRMRDYYGRPVIMHPVWLPPIPFYFFTGGLGGASAVLGYVARERGNDELADAALWTGLAADTLSPLLLIQDLGRPERFYNMLRVFKVTSPMNVGSWILAASGTVRGLSAAAHLLGRTGLRDGLEKVDALLGMPLATYTAVLVSNTAVPVWHDGRFELPFVFGASGAASAAAAAAIFTPPAKAAPARRLAVGSAIAETVLMKAMEKRLGFVGDVYKYEQAGRYNRAAKALTGAGAVVLATAGTRSRLAAAAGGALMLAGEVCLRWAVFKAGYQSAENPRYTVEPQRERVERRGGHASSRWGRERGFAKRRGAGDPQGV
jgi:formate-dependent nitrite reductase membrane component NrfD